MLNRPKPRSLRLIDAAFVQNPDGEWLLMGAVVTDDGAYGWAESIAIPNPDEPGQDGDERGAPRG